MRIGIIALALALGGCQYIEYPLPGPDAGNPNHYAYAGGPGSLYDRAANPPSNIGQVTYDPNAPLANNLPADETLPPSNPSVPPAGPVTATPLPPMAAPGR